MNCISISIKELETVSQKWANNIKEDYSPDLIVYVAKAGFLLGVEMSNKMSVPLIGVETIRPTGNTLKDRVAPIVRKLPSFIRNIFITLELKSGIHKKNNYREVRFIDSISEEIASMYKKVLVVDDSVDTGASIKAVIETLKPVFLNAEIRIASLNVWDKSEEIIKTDYYMYRNTVIKAPMSKDSNEYELFLQMYKDYIGRKA